MENPQEPGVTPLCKILEWLVCWPSSPQAGVRSFFRAEATPLDVSFATWK